MCLYTYVYVYDRIELTVTESLNVELDRDHTMTKFEVKGNFEVVVNNPDCSKCVIHTGVDPNAKLSLGRVKWNLHPRMDEANWKQGILALKDADKSFRIGRACKTSILRWRLTSTKEEAIPIRIEFWPETELNKIRVNATYSVEREEVQLKNVIINFPTPLRFFIFIIFAFELRWIIGDVATDAKGSFEYRLENCELEGLWPVTAHFDIEPMYSGMSVAKVTLQGNESTEFQFDVKAFCHAETYRLGEAS
ncbi:coatomer subunit delta [Reticulomyxa filosa]|uniref:Coatomer subunit delta n=1 Tax=Reticulomyxa filosa TaxID=46433 RepID=X6PD66_RETFI|nr:coatomer subunit delta [Reticulomyxa filosa]|eukprot:ETO35622.1 coatomer subunit delta [Reticulomyxa filosa]